MFKILCLLMLHVTLTESATCDQFKSCITCTRDRGCTFMEFDGTWTCVKEINLLEYDFDSVIQTPSDCPTERPVTNVKSVPTQTVVTPKTTLPPRTTHQTTRRPAYTTPTSTRLPLTSMTTRQFLTTHLTTARPTSTPLSVTRRLNTTPKPLATSTVSTTLRSTTTPKPLTVSTRTPAPSTVPTTPRSISVPVTTRYTSTTTPKPSTTSTVSTTSRSTSTPTTASIRYTTTLTPKPLTVSTPPTTRQYTTTIPPSTTSTLTPVTTRWPTQPPWSAPIIWSIYLKPTPESPTTIAPYNPDTKTLVLHVSKAFPNSSHIPPPPKPKPTPRITAKEALIMHYRRTQFEKSGLFNFTITSPIECGNQELADRKPFTIFEHNMCQTNKNSAHLKNTLYNRPDLQDWNRRNPAKHFRNKCRFLSAYKKRCNEF